MQQMTERQRERQRVGDETSGMRQMAASSVDKVLANHIYEYKKGVRRMILFTCNRRFEQQACHRLCRQSIDYVVQPAGKENVNVYFGRRECLDAIRLFVTRPLNELTPEEDFILGAMLGYDICAQCERYCERKGRPLQRQAIKG